MENPHPEVAVRIGLRFEKSMPIVGITFFSTNTGIHVDPSIEKEIITVPAIKPALGELYMHLKQAIEESPEDFGFQQAHIV